MKNLTKNLFFSLFLLTSATMLGQGKIKGRVVSDDNLSMPGANVVVKGSKSGTTTDVDGKFTLKTTNSSGTITVTSVGYQSKTVSFTVKNNETVDLGTIKLSSNTSNLDEVVVKTNIIDIAKERKTPVAVSTIKAAEIQQKLGNQEFPMALKSTPSVYASNAGGGFGDSRINIRGFTQENVAVMINGMPVNDMESGAVFWSNWAGLSDVTSAMQVQRGLGSSKLAIASVGGTINIVTRSSNMKEGGSVMMTTANDNYLKTQVSYSTGLLSSGLSASILFSNTRGDGYINGTNFRGNSYFLALGYSTPNKKHQLEFTFTGAAQWHHQRFGAISISQALMAGDGTNPNVKYNRDWGYLQGSQFNINQNFYNKPVGSLNYDFKINDNTKLSAIIYGSWGRGGGAAGRGRSNGLTFDNDLWRTRPNGIVDYDKIYAYNSGQTVQFPTSVAFTNFVPKTRLQTAGQYLNDDTSSNSFNGISQISGINSHNWYGTVIDFNKKVNNLTFDLGLDYRTYRGIHVRYLNNLLGGTLYKDTADINNNPTYTDETSSPEPSLNPFFNALTYKPILRNWEGIVDWLGGFGQIEYSRNNLTAYMQGSVSQQGFKRIDYFVYKNSDPLQTTDVKKMIGYNVKGGANYNIGKNHNVFANIGYYSKQPFLSSVYPNNRNILNANLTNEKILGFEAGYGFTSSSFNAKLNLYQTSWKDRYLRSNDTATAGTPPVAVNPNGFYDFSGITEIHQGLELEMTYKVIPSLKINAMASYGDWKYSGNSFSNRFDVNGDPVAGGTLTTLYLDGAKVGNTAQITAAAGATYEVVKNLNLDASYNYYDKLYAFINPANFSSATNKGSLELPSFGLVDAGFSYKLMVGKDKSNSVNFRANVNNLLDTVYIAESSTNVFASDFVSGTSGPTHESAGNLYNGVAKSNNVWFGFGRTWNFGITYKF